MNLRKEFPDIAKLIDELREHMEFDQPSYLKGHGIEKGKKLNLAIGWYKDGICHRREK